MAKVEKTEKKEQKVEKNLDKVKKSSYSKKKRTKMVLRMSNRLLIIL